MSKVYCSGVTRPCRFVSSSSEDDQDSDKMQIPVNRSKDNSQSAEDTVGDTLQGEPDQDELFEKISQGDEEDDLDLPKDKKKSRFSKTTVVGSILKAWRKRGRRHSVDEGEISESHGSKKHFVAGKKNFQRSLSPTGRVIKSDGELDRVTPRIQSYCVSVSLCQELIMCI